MHPVLLKLGTIPVFGGIPLTIHTYGTLMAIGFLLAMWYAARAAQRRNLGGEWVYDLGIWILVAAVVGARAAYVLFEEFDYYLANPLQVFSLSQGGLVFYGGFIASSLTVIVYAWRKKLRLWLLADILIPSLAVGHALGRLGCLAFGCCYGVPWEPGVCFPPGSPAYVDHAQHGLLAPGAAHSLSVFPTQLVEAGLNLLIFAILLRCSRRVRYEGWLFVLYLFLYAPVRFALEFFRADWRGEYLLSLSVSQWISIALLGIGTALHFYLRRRPAA